MSTMPLFLRIALLLTLFSLLACGPNRSSRGDDDDDSATDDDDAADDDDASNAEEQCLQLPAEMCLECMGQLYPQGQEAYLAYFTQFIYCGETCSWPCSSFCQGQGAPDAACDQCANTVDPQSADAQLFSEACSNDPQCVEYYLAGSACFE